MADKGTLQRPAQDRGAKARAKARAQRRLVPRFARLDGIALIALFALAVLGIQIWATIHNTRKVIGIVEQLEPIEQRDLPHEKTRQEILALRIENQLRGYFWSSLLSALGPTAAAFVTLLGAWLGLRSYVETRRKERLDRAASDLKGVLENLVSDEARKRAVGVAGLQHFLTEDKSESHLQVVASLATAARLESDAEVLRSIRIAVEQAARTLPEDRLQQVSWQGAKLRGVDLAGHSLRELDLRDADLEDADLSGCDLEGALFTAARLNGARLDQADLTGATLAYTDFAGASLVGAVLERAVLHHAKVLGADLAGADLKGALFEPDEVPWRLVKNWRDATFDPGLLARLVDRYGPKPHGVRVLMLMWEVPPLVAGGTWTACYHLVRQLRRRGADLVVAVPWDASSIDTSPFGCEVEVVPLGIPAPRAGSGPYAGAGASAPFSPYSSGSPYLAASPYAGAAPRADWFSAYRGIASPYGTLPSPYAASASFSGGWSSSPYGPYSESFSSPYGRFGLRQPFSALRLIEELERRLLRHLQHATFDVLHAHDWVTFDAANAAATRAQRPWIAHFHSTESDRRPGAPDPVIEAIERAGAQRASAIVVPSRATARRLEQRYAVPPEKINVVPNPLSREAIDVRETGSFETHRTVFLGRLTAQKGPDLFARVAEAARPRIENASFWMYGDGEDAARLSHWPPVELRGPLRWSERGAAFSEASALLVPSRAEPFGMVVLEAMQHRVPVLYTEEAGAAEVLQSGVKVRSEATEEVAIALASLLGDWQRWVEVVEAQAKEIAEYPDRGYEQELMAIWERATARTKKAAVAVAADESRALEPPRPGR
jgi:uncharacterized protein YjbI with pentapeptide repeats/glycosyltransferase involved in cell wall biosynthesis